MKILGIPETWSVATLDEARVLLGNDVPVNNSWAAVRSWDQEVGGTAGVTQRIKIRRREIDWLILTQGRPFWQWAAAQGTGKVYNTAGQDLWAAEWAWWPCIAQASSPLYPRVLITIDAFSDSGRRVRVVCLRRRDDYSAVKYNTPQTPRIFARNGYDAKGGYIFYEPLFDPRDFDRSTGRGTEIWLEREFLHALVRKEQDPDDGGAGSFDVPGFPAEITIRDRDPLLPATLKRPLSMRPGPSMQNVSVDKGIFVGRHVPVIKAVQNQEGVFALLMDGPATSIWLPVYLVSTNLWYVDGWRG